MCKVLLSCILTPIIILLAIAIIVGSTLLALFDKWLMWMDTIFNMSTFDSHEIHEYIIDVVAISSLSLMIVLAALCMCHNYMCC